MFEKIKELIVESLGIEEDQVTMEASFKEDLKVDSLDLFEMVMSLEDEFDVEIPTEELEKMETVGDVVEYIKEHKQAEGQRMKTVITELILNNYFCYLLLKSLIDSKLKNPRLIRFKRGYQRVEKVQLQISTRWETSRK